MYARYAVFFTPDGPFAEFGAAWLGWDSALGRAVPHPVVPGREADIVAWTARPRRYGFHATLKAPFRLAERAGQGELIRAVEAFGARMPAVEAGPLALSDAGGFLALRPVEQPRALTDLAAAAVRDLDGFRAPLSEADIARRREVALTPEQDAQLLEWGYPFVFDDFHFHMTLSGPLADPAPVAAVLEPLLAGVVPDVLRIATVTLMGEDREGLFHQVATVPLSG